MVKNGSLLIGYTPLKLRGYVNFFRIIIENKLCEHSDMDYVVQEIERLGKDVVVWCIYQTSHLCLSHTVYILSAQIIPNVLAAYV